MKLKVVLLVKQVPDHEAIVQVRPDGSLEIEERYVCSFYDEIAMEAALGIRKTSAEVELVAISAGGRRASDALRRAVALGFDQVERLGDERLDQMDGYAVASVLAARLRDLKPDLVMCGKQAGDDDQAAVGPMVAELLGMPHVSAAVSFVFDPAARTVQIGRKVEGEIWTLKSGLPLLFTAEKGLAQPHIPVVTRVMKALKANIPNIPIQELLPGGLGPAERVRRLRFRPPPSRPAVTIFEKPFPENVSELVARLQQLGVLT